MVLSVDLEREKIGLGLKQKSDSPWSQVLTKYPAATRTRGTVVNIMSYGVFVKLEEGLEGLVHISEMSWTKRLNHPSEMVSLGEEVDVVVLGTNKEKQEIDFLITRDGEPWLPVEAKLGDTTPSPNWHRFMPQLPCPLALQLCAKPGTWRLHEEGSQALLVASAAEALYYFP